MPNLIRTAPIKSSGRTNLILATTLILLGPGYFLFSPFLTKEEVKNSNRLKGVPYFQYILVGGGTASVFAMQAIKEREANADIMVISEEPDLPYHRPPLSKELWGSEDTHEYVDWQGNVSSIYFNSEDEYERMEGNLTDFQSSKTKFLNASVQKIDPETKTLTLKDGRVIQYDKLLLATGGRPFKPDFVEKAVDLDDKVTTYRTLNDYRKLKEVIEKSETVAVIGGGFLGSELVSQLIKKNVKVVQIFPEDGNLSLVLPHYLTKWTTKKLESEGVVVKAASIVQSLQKNGDKVDIQLAKEIVSVDHVVIATGLIPNTDLARISGLEIDSVLDGVVVNSEMEARTDIYAAGVPNLSRRRVEHYDNAVNGGRVAGLNMTGMNKPYTHQSMFWSNIGKDVSFEAVGHLDSSMQTVSVWSKEGSHDRGVVYYLKKKKVVGVLLWNLSGNLERAREMVRKMDIVEDPSILAKQILVN